MNLSLLDPKVIVLAGVAILIIAVLASESHTPSITAA